MGSTFGKLTIATELGTFADDFPVEHGEFWVRGLAVVYLAKANSSAWKMSFFSVSHF